METDGNSRSAQARGDSFDERDARTVSRSPQVNVPSTSVGKKYRYYKMDYERRGSAIIFNHEHFTVPGLKQRRGTQTDCDNLKLQLESLHFDVVVHNDLDYKDVREKVIGASKEDYTNCDCFMMAVLSHGNQGILFARDDGYETEFLWSLFAADKVPTLAGKPKMFFIQACHDREHREVTLSRIETDGSPISYKIPTHADFLIVYSTVSVLRFCYTKSEILSTHPTGKL